MIVFLLILLAINLSIGALAYFKIMKIHNYYNKVYPHLKNLNKQWTGFIRQDRHNWDTKEILIGCFLRFPIKILIFLQYIIVCFVIIILTTPFGSEFCNKILRIYGRYYGTYVFNLIWTINDPSGLNHKVIKTPLLISNHVCWIDTMYLIVTFYPISFLSKSEVAKTPLIGKIATNAQSIYIERNDQNARGKIVEDIKVRVNRFMEKAKEGLYAKIYPLIIFPEGTTSNGKSLLKFKVGAFNDLAPLTIVGLKYTCDNFDVGMVEITQSQHFLLSFCLRIRLNVVVGEIEANPKQTPEQYCERAQEKMVQMTGFKCYNAGFRCKKEHEQLVKMALKEKKIQKSQKTE